MPVDSLSHLVRPAAGTPEGLLVLFHGRGADERDLFPLLDVLDPERRLLGAPPAGPLPLPPRAPLPPPPGATPRVRRAGKRLPGPADVHGDLRRRVPVARRLCRHYR